MRTREAAHAPGNRLAPDKRRTLALLAALFLLFVIWAPPVLAQCVCDICESVQRPVTIQLILDKHGMCGPPEDRVKEPRRIFFPGTPSPTPPPNSPWGPRPNTLIRGDENNAVVELGGGPFVHRSRYYGGCIDTRRHITEEMKYHQDWMLSDFFLDNILPAMMMMTEQLVTAGMYQMMVLGALMDAQNQLETQRLLQEKMAEAHKDYHPSMDMCVIGTMTKSLAHGQRNGQFNAFVMAQRSLDRQIGHITVGARLGEEADKKGRLEVFIKHHCDVKDNNNGLNRLCNPDAFIPPPTSPPPAKAPPPTVNNDINYTRTVDAAKTLAVDFTDTGLTPDEIDIMAMASNLYAHDIFKRIDKGVLEDFKNQDEYLDLRAVVAKRSIAENTFNTIVGMKSVGTKNGDTEIYVKKLLEQLGISDADRIIQGKSSYYAQMEMLAQKIYQTPDFFTNLYDKPMNVVRKDVAMQAINLMLDRDAYKSELRSEALLAVLLELEVIKYQRALQSSLDKITERDREGP